MTRHNVALSGVLVVVVVGSSGEEPTAVGAGDEPQMTVTTLRQHQRPCQVSSEVSYDCSGTGLVIMNNGHRRVLCKCLTGRQKSSQVRKVLVIDSQERMTEKCELYLRI